jgi:hypothetical protein
VAHLLVLDIVLLGVLLGVGEMTLQFTHACFFSATALSFFSMAS